VDTFVEPLPLSRVETGEAGEEARFMLRFWKENNGIITRDKSMTWLSRQLMMFLPEFVQDDVPPSTFIGKDTTFRRYFPNREAAAELPKSYRSKVARGYHAAVAKEPWYDIQRTGALMGPGTPDLVLERLILNFRTPAGFERVFCLMRLVEDCTRSGLSDPERHPVRFRQETGHCRSGWAHRMPSAPHSHVAV